MKAIDKQVRLEVLQIKLQNQQHRLEYYKGQAQEAYEKDQYENMRSQYNDQLYYLKNDIQVDPLKYEDELTLIICLRRYIGEQMRLARDFSENKYIVINSYRRAITAKNILATVNDKYKDLCSIANCRYFLKY
jgi:hypothetical protein